MTLEDSERASAAAIQRTRGVHKASVIDRDGNGSDTDAGVSETDMHSHGSNNG